MHDTDTPRYRQVRSWLRHNYLTVCEATTFASTIAALAITLVMLQHPAVSEANPIADWIIHEVSPIAAAGIAFAVIAGAFTILRRASTIAPKTTAAGALSLVTLSVADAVRNAYFYTTSESSFLYTGETTIALFTLASVAWLGRDHLRDVPSMINSSMPSISRGQWSAILFAFLMIASLPAMSLAGGLGGTAQASDTTRSLDGGTFESLDDIQLSQTAQATDGDNGVIYSGSSDETVKALDAETGEEIWESTAHSDSVRSVAPSPDGDIVYSGSQDETVKALDAETGEEIWESTAHSNRVNTVAPSPDGDIVYSGSSDNTVKALDAETGEEMWESTAHSHSAVSIAPSPDGDIIYSGSLDETVKALDAETGEEMWESTAHSDNVYSVAPSPDGDIVYSGSSDNTVKALDAETGEEMWEFDGHSDTVTNVGFGSDGNIITGSYDETSKKLDYDTGEEIWSVDLSGQMSQYSELAALGDSIYFGLDDGNIAVVTDGGDDADITNEYQPHEPGEWVRAGSMEGIGNLPSGEPITVTVTDQHGDQVYQEDITVEAWGVNEPNFGESDAADLYDRADELRAELEDPMAADLEAFTDDYADVDDIDDLTRDATLDADALADDVDATYPLVHEPQDWDASGGFGTTWISEEVDAPRLQVDEDEPVVITAWDVDEGGWGIAEGPVANSFPGEPVEDDLVIEQLSPTGETVDTRTAETEPIFKESRLTGDIEWHGVRTDLPPGIYRVHPEDSPEASYHFAVGDPDTILTGFQSDLRDEADRLTDRAEHIENLLEDDIAVRETSSTDRSGQAELEIDPDVGTVTVQAYGADEYIVDVFEDVGDFDELSMSHLVDYRDGDWDLGTGQYEGTFTLPGEQKRINPADYGEDDVVEIEVIRSDSLPFSDMDEYDSFLDEIRDGQLNETVDDMLDEWGIDDIEDIDDAEDLMDELEDVADGNEHLEDALDDSRDDLDEDAVESIVDSILDDHDDALDEDDIETIIDDVVGDYDDGLTEDDLEQILEDYDDDLDEDDIEDIVDNVLEDTEFADIREDLEDYQDAIDDLEDQLEDIEVGDGDGDVDDGELSMTWPIDEDVGIDDIAATVSYADGTTETIDSEEYFEIGDTGVGPFASNTVELTDYPLPDDAAVADVQLHIATDDGYGTGDGSVQNPAFDGEFADIDAIRFNTLSPGASESVRATFDADAGAGFDRITDAEVRGPDGQSITPDVDDETVSFRADGAGVHVITATVESSSGHEFRISERIEANEHSRSDPPTIRASDSSVGDHAVVGEGLESARLETDDGTLEADAILGADDDPPGELHIRPGDALDGSDVHELDLEIVRGSSEERISSHVSVFWHFDDGVPEDTLFRSNGEAVTHDGDTRWGELDVRGEDDEKAILVTFTDESGQLSAEANTDPGPIDRVMHWLDTTVVPIPLGVFAPLFDLILTLAAEVVTAVANAATTTAPTLGPTATPGVIHA